MSRAIAQFLPTPPYILRVTLLRYTLPSLCSFGSVLARDFMRVFDVCIDTGVEFSVVSSQFVLQHNVPHSVRSTQGVQLRTSGLS